MNQIMVCGPSNVFEIKDFSVEMCGHILGYPKVVLLPTYQVHLACQALLLLRVACSQQLSLHISPRHQEQAELTVKGGEVC